MKIGVKTFDNPQFLKRFENEADFFEIMAVEGKDYSFLAEFNKPFVIHVQHEEFNLNNASGQKRVENIKSIKFALEIAAKYGSDKVIVHPGYKADSRCSEEEFISLIKEINDSRIIIENMPFQKNFICASPEEISEAINSTKAGFCLDITHAIQAAYAMNRNWAEMLKEFINLKPVHYHFGGQKPKIIHTAHFSFADSEIDTKEILKLIPADASITLEVTRDPGKTFEDIKTIRNIIREL